METIAKLTTRHAGHGKLCWIGTRSSRKGPIVEHRSVVLDVGGISGDRHTTGGKRTVTLIQQEHLKVISSLIGGTIVTPIMLRRNLAISGINLLALRNRQFRIGEVILEGTGICAPCSRMEKILGPGGYNAVRGHGGITAKVIDSGTISLDDEVSQV